MLYSESSIQIFLVRGRCMFKRNEMVYRVQKKMNLVLHYHANTTLPLSPVISHVGLSVNHAHLNTDTHTVYITDAHTLWFPLQKLRKPDTFLPHRLSRRTVQAGENRYLFC